MEILFKENVIFDTFSNESDLRNKILSFIYDSKTSKILYKGDPNLIEYKLLKKIIPIENIKYNHSKTNINNFVEINNEKNVREIYEDFLSKINTKLCLIYKIS